MREEQATTDSRFSRYVGHTGGGLFCIFFPSMSIFVLSPSLTSSLNQLFTDSFHLSVAALLFISLFVFDGPLWLFHATLDKVGERNRVKREIKSERHCQWRQHFYWLSCFFQLMLCLIKGLPVVISPSVFAANVATVPLFSLAISQPSNHLHFLSVIA